MGDSWASGVTWSGSNSYDGNKDGCMRYKYAWSTVVRDRFNDWVPGGKDAHDPNLEFEACSGAKLEDMKGQMDKMTRPKLVIMEAGGNNLDFYPMADSCLFHSIPRKDYKAKYEDDNAENPDGECRREINLVRTRIPGIEQQAVDVINTWRSHQSVWGNDATLMYFGYPWFFAFNPACNDWSFTAQWATQEQLLVEAMRKDFNSIIDGINGAIKRAVDSFGDPKIQYLDINRAFQGHRFCEPGHTFPDQLNGSKKVYLWNSPARQFVAIRNGADTKVYEAGSDPSDTTRPPPPPMDEFSYLLNYPEGKPQLVDGAWLTVYRDPKDAFHSMEIRGTPEDYSDASSGGSNGYIARTLHPTQDGHKAMGDIISQRLAQIYGRTNDNTIEPPSPCPFGCTCFESGFQSCT